MKENDFSAFPKLINKEADKYYNVDENDNLPGATPKQKAYITILLDKKGLDMLDLYDFIKKDIDELNIDEASECISHFKAFRR